MILKPFMREGIMPLPVTLISTISADGVRNIAPYSCVMPVLRPLDLVCVATAAKRDTLANIRQTGQFVINLPGVDRVDAVIPTARFTPPEADEFELAGLAEKPSVRVAPPGIAGCYAWMECETEKIFEEKKYLLIMGKVVHLEVDDQAMGDDGALDLESARPLMMTGSNKGMHFCRAVDTGRFEPFSAMFPSGRDPLGGKYTQAGE